MAVVPDGRASTTGYRVRERFPAWTLLELDLERVDLLVGGDDALGEREVRVEQRRRRAGHRRPHEPGHLDHAVAELGQLAVEVLTHPGSSSSSCCAAARPCGCRRPGRSQRTAIGG